MKVEELKALAEKATPGPWRQGITLLTATTRKWSAEALAYSNQHERKLVLANFRDADEGRSRKRVLVADEDSDAAYIAALSPDRVLAMIRVIEAAKEVRANLIFGTDLPPITDFDVALAALEDQ